MDAAAEIRSTISMLQVCEQYGFEPNRAGYIACPFHAEKTPSLKVYKEVGRGFHCFGCGAGGGVIEFIMQYFNLDFRAAIVRLNYDFRLGLINDEPQDWQRIAELKRKKLHEQRELNAFRKEYQQRSLLFRELWIARRDFSPKTPEEQLHPLFVQALTQLDYLEYWFEENPWR